MPARAALTIRIRDAVLSGRIDGVPFDMELIEGRGLDASLFRTASLEQIVAIASGLATRCPPRMRR